MLPEHRASLELTHATDPQSCPVDSSRTRRAVIGKRLENVHEALLVKRGLSCHQLPFRNETVHRCGELVPVRQPCSNLVEQRHKRLSMAWHGNSVIGKNNVELLLLFSLFPVDFTFRALI